MKRLIALIGLLLLIPGGAFSAPLHPAALRALDTARQHMAAEEYDQAAETLESFIARRPAFDACQLEFTLGTAYALADKHNEARPHYRAAVRLNPQCVRSWLNLAATELALDDPAAAASCYICAYRLEPRPEVLHQAAVCYLQAGDAPRARPGLEELAARPDARPEWLEAMVHCYLSLDMPAEGIPVARRLTAKTDARQSWWLLLAQCHLLCEDYPAALTALRARSLLITPTARDLEILGDMDMAAGLPREGARDYARSLAAADSDRVAEKQIRAHLAAHQSAEALKVINARLAQGSDDGLSMLKGRILYQDQNYAAAADSFSRCKTGEAKLMLGYCALARQDHAGARAAFEQARRHPEMKQRASEMLTRLTALADAQTR